MLHQNLTLLAAILASTFLPALPRLSAAERPTAKQVWDYADDLGLNAAQRAATEEVRRQIESARARIQSSQASNTPPDVQRSAQLNYRDQLRLANRRMDQVLTEEQKSKLTGLRRRSRTESTTESAGEPDTPEAAPAASTRKPPRPSRTEAENKALAAELRANYSQPVEHWPAPNLDDSVKAYYVELGLLPPVKFPDDNPYTDAKAELGRKLFFDPRLSGSKQISCASCHDPDLAFADGRTVSFGHERKELRRNAPTVLNTAFNSALFWDGRADSLEAQARQVINNPDEMHANPDLVRERLLQLPDYTNAFAAVFGSPEPNLFRVAQAIATFERTITSRGNDFDSFLRGDTNALSDEAIRGLHLFRTTARCVNCHHGPTLTDGRFHNEGLTYYGRKYEDLGRYAVTKRPEDVGKFKTPALRNIGKTAPYMHNGLFQLQGVLNMYNAGMPTIRRKTDQQNDPLFPSKSPLLQPLGLNPQDLADLKAFLESLNETPLRLRPPELPVPSTRTVEDNPTPQPAPRPPA